MMKRVADPTHRPEDGPWESDKEWLCSGGPLRDIKYLHIMFNRQEN